jgi:hypothetical protein
MTYQRTANIFAVLGIVSLVFMCVFSNGGIGTFVFLAFAALFMIVAVLANARAIREKRKNG